MMKSADPRVLVVDDYQNMRLMVKNMLRQLGYREIDFAADGGSAVSALRTRAYDLIISDWKMQPMSGTQLLQLVRNDLSLGAPRFIMITGNREIVKEAEALGVDATVVKPFSVIDLKEAVARARAHRDVVFL